MQHRRIIKQGPVVVATHEDGSMDPESPSSHGIFLGDTRFLSCFQIWLEDTQPILLASSEEALFQSSYLQTNCAMGDLPERAIGVLQRNTIEPGRVRIQITLVNWALRPAEFEVCVELDSDFYDSFEARGVKRLKRGTIGDPKVSDSCVELSYLGLDQVTRMTRISTDPPMSHFADRRMHFPIKLADTERTTIDLELQMFEKAPEGVTLQPAPDMPESPKPAWFDDAARMATSNQEVEAIIRRSVDDLEVLLIDFADVWIPAAGLPRFSVPFGRDALVTGLQTLMWNPVLSRDVLRFLATRQGKEENPWNYEQPGKIMHEMHTGELARLKEVPFGLFYGSVDSTLLFLVLGAEYVRWTGDLALFRELKPNFDAAWKWADTYGNIDGSGYVQYQAHTPPRASSAALTVGLFNQGWKDSSVAVMYSDGSMCTDHPVSLSEVQGYLYRALRLWGEVCSAMPEQEGMWDEGARLLSRAQQLKEQFNREFWMPDKGYYAMALDGHHRQVDSITSNPGHCLWTRLIDDENAEQMVKTLMSEPMFSAWGIRTMANNEKAYNPFSYHDGSIWPWENSIIASGLKKYGFVVETQAVFDSLVEASRSFEYRRWPEVYCGVSKQVGGVLARQPDACRPQAWSAGAIFLFLQTILGMAPLPFSRRVDVTPALPTCFREIIVDNVNIVGCRLGLRLVKEGNSVLMEIRDNPDDLEIVVLPVRRNNRPIGENAPATSK